MLRKVLNAAIAVLAAVCWFWLAFHMQGASFTANGLRSLKYFTVVSNLLAGFAAAAWLLRPEARSVYLLKLTAAVSLFITFVVTAGFLGPIYGYRAMYAGANLWFHLLIPLLACGEVLFLEDRIYSAGDCLYGVTLLLVYGIVYGGNIILNGTGTPPHTNDWYSFARWGIFPAGACIFLGLTVLAYGSARLLAYIQKKRWGKKV